MGYLPAFDVIVIVARPAAGKSEVIDYLKNINPVERLERFHIRKFEEIDDFPMLWTWFEEDHLLRDMGYPGLHTDQNGYLLENYLWNLLIERLCLEYKKKISEKKDYHHKYTTIIEFSRGNEHGGYQSAFSHLSSDVLTHMGILYLNVSWEESLRKNRKRFNPKKPGSILEHSLPDEKMERLYKENDWTSLTSNSPDYLLINGIHVPYAIMENEDDVTTIRGEALGNRLEMSLNHLWENYQKK